MNTIAERIKFAMKVKNKKQIEIVRDTGISKGAFSSYLSGQYNPKLDKLQLIADSLDVDVKWLSGENVPMQTATQNTDTVQQYLFYNNSCSEYLIDDTFDTYIGLMNEHSALVPRFLVLVNPSMNEMHLLPIFIKKDSSRFYNCPPALLIPNGHSTFTKDFDSVHMVLETSVIYYYGINTETCEPEITELTYSQSEKCYQITDGQFIRPIEEFEKELAKEALYLKQKRPIITDKRTCKVSDLSSPLLYHGVIGNVRSVKDCPTAYRLRLVP